MGSCLGDHTVGALQQFGQFSVLSSRDLIRSRSVARMFCRDCDGIATVPWPFLRSSGRILKMQAGSPNLKIHFSGNRGNQAFAGKLVSVSELADRRKAKILLVA
jgi:hypothetical protein